MSHVEAVSNVIRPTSQAVLDYRRRQRRELVMILPWMKRVNVVAVGDSKVLIKALLSIGQKITVASEARRCSSSLEAGHRKQFPGFASFLRSRCGQLHKLDE